LPNKLVIITAPSGSGKTTICKFLLNEFPMLQFSISATTREKREGETDGKDYYFLSKEDFIQKINQNEFLEFEEVYEGRYYGTLRSEVQRLWDEGCDALFDIDVQGAVNLKTKFSEIALLIFIQAPLDQLEERLRQRNTETEHTLKTRLEKSIHEMEFKKYADVVIHNEVLERAMKETADIVAAFLQQ
jgi:guanylate kinase